MWFKKKPIRYEIIKTSWVLTDAEDHSVTIIERYERRRVKQQFEKSKTEFFAAISYRKFQ